MSRIIITITLLLSCLMLLQAQERGGMAPGMEAIDLLSSQTQQTAFLSTGPMQTENGFVYSTTTHTFADIIVFSYFDNTNFYIRNATGVPIDSVMLHRDQYYIFSTGTGVYRVEANQSFTVLIGDPITNSVMGYYAVDESGSPLSTRLNTYMPKTSWSGEHFIVFAYHDQTEFQIKSLSDGSTTIAAGILNKGEHFQLDGQNNKFLGVYANKPVSALSYTDQGYFVPASNGTFAGHEFYGFSGYIGSWANGIVVTSYEDSTDFYAVNSATGDTIMQGSLNKGEVASHAIYGDTYWKLYSTGKVTVSNTPYAGWSGSYYYLARQIDESGLGIGTNFYAPIIVGDVNLFSYHDDNEISIVDMSNGTVIWSDTLQSGEGYGYNNSTKGVYHFTSTYNIAVIASFGGGFGADFMPLNFAVGLPDLAVSSGDIRFDPEAQSYQSGEIITIHATIHNYGFAEANDVKVRFYDGHPSGNNAISPLMNVPSIPSKESVTLQQSWQVPEFTEYRNVYVIVDPHNTILESNNSNNLAYRSLIPNSDLLPPLPTTVDAPASVGYDNEVLEFEQFTITVNVFNSGTVVAENAWVKLNVPAEWSLQNPVDSVVVLGNIDAAQSATYSWVVNIDQGTNEDAYFYSLLVDADNADAKTVNKMLLVSRPTSINPDEGTALLPKETMLYPNYPNPFNPTTFISYQLTALSDVDLSIYNLLGQKVAILVAQNQPAGRYSVEWDARGFPSGIYYYRLSTSNGYTATRKLVLMK